MRVLGLDTSTRAGSVALLESGRVRGGIDLAGDLDHSRRLLPAVHFLLDRLGLVPADLDCVAVTVGPGSFTGVRVGLATAAGLARAAGIPAVGVVTLEALAQLEAERDPSLAAAGKWICPWIDAGRREVYAAAYRATGTGLERLRAPTVSDPAQWLASLPALEARFLGDGSERHRALLAARQGATLAPGGPWFLARTVAALAARGPSVPAADAPLEPLYVRAPDAERSRGGP